MQTEREERLLQMQLADREDEQRSKLDEIYLRELMDKDKKLAVEDLRGKYLVTSYNMQHDKDQDGIPDIMEQERKYMELLKQIEDSKVVADKGNRELDLRQQELDQRRTEHLDKMDIDRQKVENDRIKASQQKQNK
jgi:hypothetical protein